MHDGEVDHEELRIIEASHITQGTRHGYVLNQKKFLRWAHVNLPEVLSPEFKHDIDACGPGGIKKLVEDMMRPPVNKSRPPLLWEKLTSHDFMGYLTTLSKKDGSKPSSSAYSGHRSALYNLYLEFGASNAHLMENSALPKAFKGLKHVSAKRVANGEGKATTGSDPLSFALYNWTCEKLLKQRNKQSIFAHSMLTLSWNLMCRVSNASGICFNAISCEFTPFQEWQTFVLIVSGEQDALCVIFAHMKNDREGEAPREPRRIYACPPMPAICPILALALHLLLHPPNADESHLFPGKTISF